MQEIKIVGGTMRCGKENCKDLATAYCKCGCFLCVLHLADNRCIVQLLHSYSEDLLEALA